MNEPAHHPASTLFPMMNVFDLKCLAEYIGTKGLIEPIRLHQGMIIDGRNRAAACRIAGVDPRYQTAELGNLLPVLYVIQVNLHRRTLTKSQLAAIGALAVDLLRMEVLELKRQGKAAGIPPMEYRDAIAKALGISSKVVQDGISVKRENPELFHHMWAGEISLLAALGKLKTTPTQRYAQRIGNSHKQKMIDILSRVRGLCRGFAEIDLSLVDLDKAERKAWLALISQITLDLRQFSQKLKKENHEASHHQEQDDQDRSPATPDPSACPAGPASLKTETTD